MHGITLGRLAALALFALSSSAVVHAGGVFTDEASEPEYPPFEKVTKGLTKVVSTLDGTAPLYDLYEDRESGRLLAVLPAGYASQLLMIAVTVSGGHPEAGVMGPTHYAKWRKIGKQLALVAPNTSVRTADASAMTSVDHLYSDTVIVHLPILALAPGNRPVVDFGMLATKQTMKFFPRSAAGNYGPSMTALNSALATLTKAKAFPGNVIMEYEAPRQDGTLVRVAFSIGKLEGSPGYRPRKADPRVGYFYNWHLDYARTGRDGETSRYINRWNLEKADTSLKMSPPKNPIVWYIEHTTPVRYRRYVREGIQMWNEAFEKIGIVDAVEVYQQDSGSGAHMEKDPEDTRYNFFRWNMSDAAYAIGPSRSNPLTGETLDADIVWNQGLTRSVSFMLSSLSEDLTLQTFSPETLAWFDEHPSWDPRVRAAGLPERAQMLRRRDASAKMAVGADLRGGTHPWMSSTEDPTNRACRMGNQLAMDLSLAGAAFLTGTIATESEDLLDGLPEEFLGPMMRYISAHEVGHTLGLQHNMAASSIHTLEEINTPGFEGPMLGSVMDYAAANINHELGEVQGPYSTSEVGPYDNWAIAYGYGPEDKLEEVLAEVSDPDHIYLSQAAISVGSDPRNMTWDLGADNLKFVESRMGLVRELRTKLLDELVQDGDSWAEARRRFKHLLGPQFTSLFVAGKWIGATYENRDFKGDAGARAPLEDVSAADQRRALNIILENALDDDALGLTPELVRHLGKEYWWDPKGLGELIEDPNFTVHDTMGQLQSIGLAVCLNPTTLRRVYDNEFRTAGDPDAFTLVELITTVTHAVWPEEGTSGAGEFSATAPMFSSFRRNLQREHTDRLIDLGLLNGTTSPSLRTISTLARAELRRIDGTAEGRLAQGPDPYTNAHLEDLRERIAKALDAAYVQVRR